MTDPLAAAEPEPPWDIRAVGGDEVPFILASWAQSHMRSPGQPFGAAYKRYVQPTVEALLARDDVWVIGAFGDFADDERPETTGRILGWLAWTPGALPAVHYAFVRRDLRRRGMLTALMSEAKLGSRFLYTFRGQKPKFRRTGPSYDLKVSAALARRGVASVHVDISDWLERMR